MTLTEQINAIFAKKASSPAQRAVNSGAPNATENPTDAQKAVGNYRKVHLNIDGFRISIENPKGSVRSGTSPDGTKWSNVLACDYGDIRGTESVDGDPVDIYLSDHPEKGAVFVIDQIDPKTGKFDEHKVMYGFNSVEEASKTYLACYQKGWKGLGWITPVTKAEFKKWIASSNRKTKPFHEYKSVEPILAPLPSDSLGFLKKENRFVEKAAETKVDPDDILSDDIKYFSGTIAPWIKDKSVISHGGSAEGGPISFRYYSPDFHKDIKLKTLDKARNAAVSGGFTSSRIGPNGQQDTTITMDPGVAGKRPDLLAHEIRHAQNLSTVLDRYNRNKYEDETLHAAYAFSPKAISLSYGGINPIMGESFDRLAREEEAATNAQYQWAAMLGMKSRLGRLPTPQEFVDQISSMSISDLRKLRNSFGNKGANIYEPMTWGYDAVNNLARKNGYKSVEDFQNSIYNRLFKLYDSGMKPDEADKVIMSDPLIKSMNEASKDVKAPEWTDDDIEAFRKAIMSVARNRSGNMQADRAETSVGLGTKIASAVCANVNEKTAQAKDDLMEGVPTGVKLRSFIDAPATRTAIMDNVLEAVKNRFPVEDDDVRLELMDVKYEGPTSYTLEQQKKALLSNRRLGCSISGTWRLTDKRTGQVLDERRDGVIRVPYYTDRGTIINNGNEYTVISQARLSPGVYVRRKQNGELESQFNVANGLGFRIGLDRETGALNMSIGQGHVPLYPVLHALGVSDDDMRKSWGNEVANVNISKFDPRALDKVYSRYAGRRANMSLTPQEKAVFITEALAGSKLDPSVVVRTLGLENVEGVTGPVMLRAAQKLLNINRGAEDPDERDNPRFSKFYGVEDMMRERIDKDAGRLTKSMLFRAKRDRSLARIGRNALAPYLDTFLSGSGLAMPGEEANPLSILTQQSRITRLGEGGISSPDLVTPEARNVQGDYLGYVDFISGPESFGIGIDVRAALGTMKGSDNRLYNKMMDLRTGKTRYVALDDAASHTVAFPGQDPNAPQLYAMRKGVPTMVPREEVDFMVPGFGNTVSAGINMTPMPTAVQAGRQFYMSKFWEQYLPQKQGEVPLVDSLMDDGKTTYSEYYGRKIGCLTAPFAGTVTKVTDNEITIRGKDGQTHTASLVKGLPFNRLSSISFTAQVKKGDEVAEGGILANSNFTDAKTGAMNMGRNLKVAVLPAPEGVSSFEDAIVISESAAKKLATSRTYNFEQETKNGVTIARNKYLAAFPKAFTKEQAETIDDNGVVKVGTVLRRDDPMILAIGPKMLSAEDAQLGKLSSVLRNALTDKSTKWEHDWPGVVTDVVYGPHGAKVLVNSEPPVKVGDKLCYDEETEVLTTRGWAHFRDITLDDNVATLNPETFEFDYIKPSKVQSYEHKGKMYKIKSQLIDLTVTTNHNMFVQRRGHKSFELIPADDIFGKRVSYKKDGKWIGQDVEWFDFPPYVVGHRWGMITKPGVRMRMDTFLMLLGMYLSEGNSFNHGDKGAGIAIAQIKPRGIQECRRALDEAGVRYTYGGHQFTLSGRWLYNYFSQFGYSYEKYIPNFVFGLSKRQQEILFKWMMWGDGHSEKGQPKTYTTSSKRLADDFQRLCLHVGRSARIVHSGHPGDTHGGIEGRVITTKHDLYSVQIISAKLTPTVNHGHVKTQHIQQEEYVDYDGRVYCCTMPKWHVIFVRRDGNVCWCGNSPENGLKGVVGGVLEDSKMPRDAVTNEPYDMLMNPMGFLSRVAPGQIMLMNLAKVAKKTGKQIRLPQIPPPEGWQAYTERLMAENGVKDTADVFDPQTGRTIKNVGDGYAYVKAFHHLAEKKFSARGVEGAYTQDEQPAKGGEEGAKRISGFDNLALLSHGATEVIKDSMRIRGQMNDEYWRRYRLGLPVEEPGVPFIYQKFLNTLRAGGINVVEKGDVTSIMPQTDADIDELAQGRVLENAQMVDSDFQPVKGGMFDLGKTGGMGGNRWSMIALPEAVPNPMMEEPVRRVLGLTAKKMEAILSGKEELNGKTGGDAIKDALSQVNIDNAIEQARADMQNRRGSQRDNAIKVLGYLKAAKEMGMKPADWMITRVPVLPPMFRPVAKMGDVALVPDMNELYKELIEMKQNYEMLARELPASALADERLAVYGAVKAAYGLGNSITTEGQAKNLKGAIRQVIGQIPKFGMAQSKVFSKTQDLVGRSVTVPDKNLDMDQVGIPEEMAWTMYKPFVERKLVQRGYSPMIAKQMIDEKNATAKHLLEDAMEERPILMDRAPTWHKFNIMAFRPHLVKGRSIHVSPLIDSGFNMDHDGDTVNIHVPASEKAAKQALEKMLPSKNLFSLTDLKSVRYKPEKEQVSGLWALTRGTTNKPVRVFASKTEAIKAYRSGEIGPNDPIEIAESGK
jgi:DNA-directed RNA polymerase beta subunit